MACNKCSKIRCKVFGLVSGDKTEYYTTCGEYCYNETQGHNEYLGHDWNDFLPFLSKLAKAGLKRVKRITLGK